MFVYSKKLSFRHYLIVSAVTNLLVNLLGVWFFQSYARVHIGMEVLLFLVHLRTDALSMPVYRNVEDMNYHSVCLHVLADSIRRYRHR
jgi:solute carrier family 30 (zinc transporter), member 5/7